jgi:hypothetical protein
MKVIEYNHMRHYRISVVYWQVSEIELAFNMKYRYYIAILKILDTLLKCLLKKYLKIGNKVLVL